LIKKKRDRKWETNELFSWKQAVGKELPGPDGNGFVRHGFQLIDASDGGAGDDRVRETEAASKSVNA